MYTVKNSIVFKSQIGMQLWKTYMMMWISIELWKLLENIKISAKRVQVIEET
jgi:hypothetical protein